MSHFRLSIDAHVCICPYNVHCCTCLFSPIMSSLNVFGFFNLSNGHRIHTVWPSSTSTIYYTIYDSTIQYVQGPALPSDICCYSPMGDAIHPDNTVVFLLGKLWLSPSKGIHINPVFCFLFPGDPTLDLYEDALPNAQYPFIVGLGSVSATVPQSIDNTPVPVPVQLTEWVQDKLRSSSILYVTRFSLTWQWA